MAGFIAAACSFFLLSRSIPRKKRNSSSDKASVKRSCDRGILRAFEDGAAVGKDRHFIRRNAEAEKKVILTDRFDRRAETCAECHEVNRTRTFVNLYGIAAAHGDLRLGLAIEIRKFMAGTGTAVRITRHGNRLEMPGPDVAGNEAAMERVFFSGQ